MKVVEIHGYHVSFKPRTPLGNARTFIREREFLLLQLKTENGLSGWGEVFSSPWAAAAVIRRPMASHVMGRSPSHYGRIHAELLASLGYDRRGPAMMAISALDMALHDIAARALGIRVADLLGGALRERLPSYASGPFLREGPDPYGHYTEEAQTYLALGFTALKPRAGVSPQADSRMAAALRAQCGPDVGLMVDINQGYTAGAASLSAEAMASAGLLWIEEPVQPEDLPGTRAVARATRIPIAGGEALASLAGFREFLDGGAYQLLQPDLTVCGGYSGLRRVAALADAYDVPVMPHVFGTAVNFYAALQVAALLTSRRGGGVLPYPWVEYDATGNPLLELFGFPVDGDGSITLPNGPGIGIELDPARLEPWAVERWSLRL